MRFRTGAASTAARAVDAPSLTERVHFGQAAFPAGPAGYDAPFARPDVPGDVAAGGARPASGNAVPIPRRLVDLPFPLRTSTRATVVSRVDRGCASRPRGDVLKFHLVPVVPASVNQHERVTAARFLHQ